MLVLSRYKNESIMIGENIEVMIVAVRGNKVQLGITTSKEIPVHRKEVYEAIQREKNAKSHQCKGGIQESQDSLHRAHDHSLYKSG
ncbi:MAG: carbon storage regulator CsrA [Planctomycetota bacterium]|jgi:carbon storage regulator